LKNKKIINLLINLTVIAVIFLVDQVSKYIVETKYASDSKAIIENFFHITYVKNRGIAFGLFQGKIIFILILGVLAVFSIILYLHKKDEEHSMLSRFGYLFILGGAIGNLFDRIYRGYVVDFIDFQGIWKYIFNIADVAINIGVILILIEYFWEKEDLHTEKIDEQSKIETEELKEAVNKMEHKEAMTEIKQENIEEEEDKL